MTSGARPPRPRSAGSPRTCAATGTMPCVTGTTCRAGSRGPVRRGLPQHTGGLYAADLFLERVIPAIERSAAYRDGGLIDITFDEAFRRSRSLATASPTPGECRRRPPPRSLTTPAGETLNGRAVHFEPTGPNTPLAVELPWTAKAVSGSGSTTIRRPARQLVARRPSRESRQERVCWAAPDGAGP